MKLLLFFARAVKQLYFEAKIPLSTSRSIKFFVTTEVELLRPTELGLQFTTAAFRSDVLFADESASVDIDGIINQLSKKTGGIQPESLWLAVI
jgi:hypothetical protein